MKRKLVVGWGVIVVATIVVTLVLAQYWGAPWTLPSDASLERDFRSHRAQFDSLVTLARSIPGLELVHPGLAQVSGLGVIRGSVPYSSMTPERWNELQRRMLELKIAGIWPESGRVILDRAVHAAVIKGYCWTAVPPQSLAASLDGASPGTQGERYRAIGDGWYLVLRENN